MFLESFHELLEQIAHAPLAAAGVVLNLILIESLLSVDNAAVLATMVLDLPKDQRPKALRYGILGAYVFRGLALLSASLLIEIWWVKPLGGIYLLWLAAQYFWKLTKHVAHDNPLEEAREQKRSWLYRKTLGMLGPFWATVVMVEVMDAAFSIDNVIAANAYSKNIILIWTGVFIGILAMRFVTQGFVKLMERYPFLETCAYCVIALLGIKLLASGINHFMPCSAFAHFMDGPNECILSRGQKLPEGKQPQVWGDILTSVFSLLIFFLPMLSSALFGWPRHRVARKEEHL